MRKLVFFALLCAWGPIAAAGPEKLDPLLKYLENSWKRVGTEGLLALELPRLLSLSTEDERVRVRVLVATRDPGGAWDIPGFRPEAVIGRIATGSVLLTDLEEIADHPQVIFVQAVRPLYPRLDVSVPEIGVPDVWQGIPATRGEGVIVGIVDTGVDTLHPAFRVDRDGDGSREGSRILWLWDQSAAGIPDRWPFSYGEDFSREEIEQGIAWGTPVSRDTSGHGTHVAGIAAGAEASLPGVAPGAELVVVRSTFYEDTVLDGVAFVFKVAGELGLPAVVNLSLGGHGGPHDGTSLFEQAIDATLDQPGRAIVVAAGNEAEDRIHVGGEVLGPITWHVFVENPTGEANFWHDELASFAVTLSFVDMVMHIPPGTQRPMVLPGGEIFVDNASAGPDPRNGDKLIHLTWTGLPVGVYLSLTFTPSPSGGRIDGWLASSDYGYFQEGDAASTVAEPGNAHRVITVGAYITRNRWQSQLGEQVSEYRLYELAPFSSHGPTRDGRIKPDLTAPGAWILSARSADAYVYGGFLAPDGIHRYMAGTSMAAPHVTGVCALLLSLDPGADWEALKAALVGGARRDAYTGWGLPDNAWGYGKAHAPGAVAELAPPSPEELPALEVLTAPAASEALFRYTLPEGATGGHLYIYDILGRKVYERGVLSRRGIIRWDLVSATGIPVANGVYLAVLVTERGVSAPVRLVVQR